MSTWYDLKLAVLQKMFAVEDRIVKDESTSGYLSAMPQAANEGLALLATAGKFITKSIKIAQMRIDNLIDETISNPIQEFSASYSYQADRGKSYYFECFGKGVCNIYVDNVLTDTITINTTGYEAFKGLIANTDNKNVKLEFVTSYPMGVKNPAIYKDTYSDVSEIPPFTDKVKYNLKELAPDFYQIDPQGIFYEGEYQIYLQTSDFYQEGTQTLVLDRDMIGAFTVYYRAYPVHIDKLTEDSYELPIDPEVYVLLPLYMASQLYKDDDFGVANSYRNEFEVGFERLVNSANVNAYEEWAGESGWI